MIRISNIKYSHLLDESNLPEVVKKKYSINTIKNFRIVKQSIDARKKDDIHYVYTVDVSTENDKKYVSKYKNITKVEDKVYKLPKFNANGKRVVVVGFGPAGIMCSYALAKCGYKVIVLERGQAVEERMEAVLKLKNEGILDTESNIQFGEGGAGTFSDGKLTTGVNNIRTSYILNEFVRHGAPYEITYQSKPHIGTDNLVKMVKNFREDIISLGGEVRFSSKLVAIDVENNNVKSVSVSHKGAIEKIETDTLVLATGHSARDVFTMLRDLGVTLERKIFAIGARIEHSQEMISRSQYGQMYNSLPPADYKLSVKTSSGRNVYTFCMCPGGEIVPSTSEEGGIVTNGMSYFSRDGENANSALLVNVLPEDIEGDDVLGGCYFQRQIEEKAYKITNSYKAPAQTVGDFLYNNKSEPTVCPTYKPGVIYTNLNDVLPDFVCDAMKEGIQLLDSKLKGFADDGAVLTAPETRSSSPIRIVRDDKSLMSSVTGLYPCGEGAGYAGGIMTAAIDGIKVAEAIIEKG